MKIFLLILVLFSLGCNVSPRDRSSAYKSSSSSDNQDENSNKDDPNKENKDSNAGTGPKTTDEGTTPPAAATETTILPQLNHCRFSTDGQNGYEKLSSFLGKYTLCQSSLDHRELHLQLQVPSNEFQICVIPTFHSGDRSVWIGNPKCQYVPSSNEKVKFNILVNRPGFEHYRVTGVVLIKNEIVFFPLLNQI